MPFPLNPTNGQQATVNGVVYTYNSTLTVWSVLTTTLANIAGNNISATDSVSGVTGTFTNLGGTLTTAAQPNVTSVGTLTSLAVTGNITSGNLSGTNITGTLSTAAQPNITSVGSLTSLSTSGKITILYDGAGNLTDSGNMLELQDNGATSIPALAFHRPGAYATKIALNTDNALYFGGWSAGAGGQTIVSGHHNPGATNSYDLGTSALRWRNIYTQDLQLSNGIGDYTIVEGEEDLFLYNNKTGKVFKFALIEVDPSTAPPKGAYK